MKLSDFFPDMEGFTPIESGVAKTPQLPNPETQVSPFLRATLPLPLQYSGDTIKQYNRPGLSSFRIAPLPPNGIPTIVAASSSTSQASSSSSGGGSTPSEDVESINVNIQSGTSYNATDGDRNTLISMTNNSGGTVILPGVTTQGSYFVQQAVAPFGDNPCQAHMINSGGNLLVAVFKVFPGSSSVSDSLGNTWHFVATATDVGGGTGYMYYAENCAAGANTITFTGGPGASGLVLEYTNALLTNVGDIAASAVSQQSGFPTGVTVSDNEMAVYGHFVNLGASYTPGAGWTERQVSASGLIQDQVVPTAGTTVVPTFGGASGSTDTLALLGSFRMNPISQSFSGGVPKGWFCYVENTGSGTFYVIGNPNIDGGSNTVALSPNEGALFVYDGSTWRSVRGAPELTVPSTFTPILHEFLTGYNATTGLFSAAQPAFSDLSGNISVSQMNNGTGASGSTFWRGDGTWATPPGGVSSLNSLTGALNLTSSDSSISITPSGTTIDLKATGGGGGGGLGGVNLQTSNYTAVSGDAGKLITFDTSGASVITFVQEAHNFTFPTSITNPTQAYTSNVTAGNLLVAMLGDTGTVPTVTDSQGNTWTRVGTGVVGGYGAINMWWAIAGSSGPNTVTFTGTVAFPYYQVLEYNGNSATPFDLSASATGSGTTLSVSLTTTQNNDLVIAVGISNGGSSLSPGGGAYTSRGGSFSAEDANIAVAGSTTPTFTQSPTGSWGILAAAFKDSTSGGTFTLLLPASPPSSSWAIFVQNIGPGTLIVDPNGLNLDLTASTLTVSSGKGLAIFTDGTDYFTMRGGA